MSVPTHRQHGRKQQSTNKISSLFLYFKCEFDEIQVSENLAISENHYNFKVLNAKALQTTIAMMTEDKITEISCIADDSCKVFLLGVKEVFC